MELDLQLEAYRQLAEPEAKRLQHLREHFPNMDDVAFQEAIAIARQAAGVNTADTYELASFDEAADVAEERILEAVPTISSRLLGHLLHNVMRSWAY